MNENTFFNILTGYQILEKIGSIYFVRVFDYTSVINDGVACIVKQKFIPGSIWCIGKDYSFSTLFVTCRTDAPKLEEDILRQYILENSKAIKEYKEKLLAGSLTKDDEFTIEWINKIEEMIELGL